MSERDFFIVVPGDSSAGTPGCAHRLTITDLPPDEADVPALLEDVRRAFAEYHGDGGVTILAADAPPEEDDQ